MSVAKVGDINLYYEIHGKGEPLVLILGFVMHGSLWGPILDELAREHHVIVFDNRGTGRSDKPETPYTAKTMAGDVVGLLDALGIEKANVFGASMGGMIAQELAINYPERLNNLILGGTFCGIRKGISTPEAAAFLFDPALAKLPAEEGIRRTLLWVLSEGFMENSPADVERIVAAYCQYPPPVKTFSLHTDVVMALDTYDRLPEIKAPTLAIAGSKDRLMSCENARILASSIPNAELTMIENAGHFFFLDSPKEASKIVLGFLRRHPKARAKS